MKPRLLVESCAARLDPAVRAEPSASTSDDRGLTLSLPPDLVRLIAEQAAALVEENMVRPAGPIWLDAKMAAAHLCAPLSRIRKLTMTGDLPHVKDGRRVLYNREELDRFIERGGASSP